MDLNINQHFLYFRGNLKKGIELFDKAINLARNELEMTHYFTLKNAAEAQLTVLEKVNITLPGNLMIS